MDELTRVQHLSRWTGAVACISARRMAVHTVTTRRIPVSRFIWLTWSGRPAGMRGIGLHLRRVVRRGRLVTRCFFKSFS